MFNRLLNLIIALTFGFSLIMPIPQVQAGEMTKPIMPSPGSMVGLSAPFVPASLKGIIIHPDNALQFDFLINKGEGNLDISQKKQEYTKLVKYFLASLTITDKDQWVNLSPYEKNRIIDNKFGKTEMGRDLLSQDYLLKQLTSSLMYPESDLGKKFWEKIYERASKEFNTTQVPVNTFNKVWIVPDQAVVFESGNTAYILKSHLKVMLEEDYLSLQKHIANPRNDSHSIAANIVREIILPELEREVNEGKNFASLRQVVSGMILATWYKKALKESLLGKIYADQAKIKGVDQDPKANEVIYQKYLQAFKKGVFNFIKEEKSFDPKSKEQELLPRKYFAGGIKNASQIQRVKNSEFSQAMAADLKNDDRASVNLEGEFANSAMLGRKLRSALSVTAIVAAGIGAATASTPVVLAAQSPSISSIVATTTLKMKSQEDLQIEALTKPMSKESIKLFFQQHGPSLRVQAQNGDKDGEIITGGLLNRDGENVEQGVTRENTIGVFDEGGILFLKYMNDAVITPSDIKDAGLGNWTDFYKGAIRQGFVKPVELTQRRLGSALFNWLRVNGYFEGIPAEKPQPPPSPLPVVKTPPMRVPSKGIARQAQEPRPAPPITVSPTPSTKQNIPPGEIFYPRILSPEEIETLRSDYKRDQSTHPGLRLSDIETIIAVLKEGQASFLGDWGQHLSELREAYGDNYNTVIKLLKQKSKPTIRVFTPGNELTGTVVTSNDISFLSDEVLIGLDYLRGADYFNAARGAVASEAERAAHMGKYSLKEGIQPDQQKRSIDGVGPFFGIIPYDVEKGGVPVEQYIPLQLSFASGKASTVDQDNHPIELHKGELLVPYREGPEFGFKLAVLSVPDQNGKRKINEYINLTVLPARIVNALGFNIIAQRTAPFGSYVAGYINANVSLQNTNKEGNPNRAMASTVRHVQDRAMPGGIDLNSKNLNLLIKRDGKGIPLPLYKQDMAQLSHLGGFLPIITEITPAVAIRPLSRLKNTPTIGNS